MVDDDESTRAVLAEALADEGYEVAQAAEGASALALLAGWRPDLILLDLLMPEMDGWAFTAAHQQMAPPRAPVVLMTAATVGPPTTVGGRPFPAAAGTLTKPFDLDALTALVARFAARQAPTTVPALAKEAVAETQRLVVLRDAVARLRTTHATLKADLSRLRQARATRPWTVEEALQVQAGRREGERLSRELQRVRQEIAQVRRDELWAGSGGGPDVIEHPGAERP